MDAIFHSLSIDPGHQGDRIRILVEDHLSSFVVDLEDVCHFICLASFLLSPGSRSDLSLQHLAGAIAGSCVTDIHRRSA